VDLLLVGLLLVGLLLVGLLLVGLLLVGLLLVYCVDRPTHVHPIQKQAKAGATSKNGTYVGERRADAQEGIPLKDGDVLGLGAPAASDGFNPYNLVVGDVGAFLASVTAQVRKEREGGVEKTMTLMKIKREIGRHIMDVDAPGQPGIVDLTLDSDADEKIAGGRVEIVLTASPPSWYRDGYAYQLADRNLVKPSRVAMLGQLQGEEIKLTMVPPEFILDVAMQGLMKDVWAKMVLETSKKITITGRSQVRSVDDWVIEPAPAL
jgi:hypothetical protein